MHNRKKLKKANRGKSNSIIQTFSKPMTGNLVISENGEFEGLSGSKLAAKRAQSKTFMQKRQSRGSTHQRTATITSQSRADLNEQKFPQVEYQFQLSGPGKKSHFTTRAGSYSRTIAHVTANRALFKHNNPPTLDTVSSGNTNFQSFMFSDARQQATFSGPLSPPTAALQAQYNSPMMINQISQYIAHDQ